jgi:hypothetical protein
MLSVLPHVPMEFMKFLLETIIEQNSKELP